MINSLCDDARRFAPARDPTQFIARGIVPGTTGFIRCNFQHPSRAPEPIAATSVCYRETVHGDKMQVSIRIPAGLIPERFQ
jgi:hypothetical protein